MNTASVIEPDSLRVAKRAGSAAEASRTVDPWAVLAGLRFWLALIVAAGHYSMFNGYHGYFKYVDYLSGPTAVIAFLWISGYSIAASYERDQQRFYYRRFWRIAPVYVATLLVSVAIAWKFNGMQTVNGSTMRLPSPGHLAQYLFMLQGLTVLPPDMNGPIWTLAVEVFLYICTPLIARLRPSALLSLLAVSAAAFLVEPHTRHLPRLDAIHGWQIVYFSWPWLTGFYYYHHRNTLGKYLLTVLPLPLVGMPFGFWAPFMIANHAFVFLQAPVIRMTERVRGALNYLGDISYPLYLLHYPIGMALLFATHYKAHNLVVMLIVALAASGVMLHAVDLPARRFANARLKRRQRSHVPT